MSDEDRESVTFSDLDSLEADVNFSDISDTRSPSVKYSDLDSDSELLPSMELSGKLLLYVVSYAYGLLIY
mgnify:FL=1